MTKSAEQEKMVKAAARKIGIVLEVVPAREQTAPPADAEGKKRAHGVRYHVTVKRARNTTQAIAFDYWGSVADKENHTAPSTFDVLAYISSGAGPVEKVQKFFNENELTQLSELCRPVVVEY